MRVSRRFAAVGSALVLLACGARADEEIPSKIPADVVPLSSAPEPPPPTNPEEAAAATGLPATFENALGMRFGLVPGGAFTEGTGAPEDPDAAHEVRIFRPYYLQTSEVTRGQWARYAGTAAPAPEEADLPVTGVSHDEAQAFVRWLAETDPRWAYRLPTEAEWDWALLSGRPRANPEDRTPWGLRGMTAAPAEWCHDWYGGFPFTTLGDPWGPATGETRVVRPGPLERLEIRSSLAPGTKDQNVGFRVMTPAGYGGDERGRHRISFLTFGGRPGLMDGPEEGGYRVRVVQMLDRLTARREGRRLPWYTLPTGVSPLRVKMVPGRYYAQCFHERDGKILRGLEMKFAVLRDDLVVRLPVPHPQALLQDPE